MPLNPSWRQKFVLTKFARLISSEGDSLAKVIKFLAEYTQPIPELGAGAFFSEVRKETPFFQVAEYASKCVQASSSTSCSPWAALWAAITFSASSLGT